MMADMLNAKSSYANMCKASAHIMFANVMAEAIHMARSHWLSLMGGSAKSYGNESVKYYSLAKME